jgi:hypothetical protein
MTDVYVICAGRTGLYLELKTFHSVNLYMSGMNVRLLCDNYIASMNICVLPFLIANH